jgi:hypothetical protein
MFGRGVFRCAFGLDFNSRKKLCGHHLCSALNHSLTDTGNGAANLRVAAIFHNRHAVYFLKVKVATAFQKTGLTFAVNHHSIMLWRLQIFESYVACEQAFNRTNACA